MQNCESISVSLAMGMLLYSKTPVFLKVISSKNENLWRKIYILTSSFVTIDVNLVVSLQMYTKEKLTLSAFSTTNQTIQDRMDYIYTWETRQVMAWAKILSSHGCQVVAFESDGRPRKVKSIRPLDNTSGERHLRNKVKSCSNWAE